MNKLPHQTGFTLIELVIIITLVTILASLGAGIILRPFQAFQLQKQRASLTDIADNALTRMSREIRSALPNSLRVRTIGARTAVEFLRISQGGYYRASKEADGSGEPLVNGSAGTFDVLHALRLPIDTGSAGQNNCLNGNADCLVIYNTGSNVGGYNAYAGDNIATITAVDTVNQRLSYDNSGTYRFPFPIPPSRQQRFYIVDTPVSFVCDTTTGQLTWYDNYSIQSAQPVTQAQFGTSAALLADNITQCGFIYNTRSGNRHSLLTLQISVTEPETLETVTLQYQVHVSNVP